ncbi:MAG: hypothetical protein ABIG96_01300 [Candidatus Micrarchaeota archaeon]
MPEMHIVEKMFQTHWDSAKTDARRLDVVKETLRDSQFRNVPDSTLKLIGSKIAELVPKLDKGEGKGLIDDAAKTAINLNKPDLITHMANSVAGKGRHGIAMYACLAGGDLSRDRGIHDAAAEFYERASIHALKLGPADAMNMNGKLPGDNQSPLGPKASAALHLISAREAHHLGGQLQKAVGSAKLAEKLFLEEERHALAALAVFGGAESQAGIDREKAAPMYFRAAEHAANGQFIELTNHALYKSLAILHGLKKHSDAAVLAEKAVKLVATPQERARLMSIAARSHFASDNYGAAELQLRAGGDELFKNGDLVAALPFHQLELAAKWLMGDEREYKNRKKELETNYKRGGKPDLVKKLGIAMEPNTWAKIGIKLGRLVGSRRMRNEKESLRAAYSEYSAEKLDEGSRPWQ